MKISAYGEFQQMRKMSQKDDAQLKENADRAKETSSEGGADSLLISPEARRKGKLRMASDYREAKVADVRSRLESGTLVTDDTLRKGASKMLGSLISGEM